MLPKERRNSLILLKILESAQKCWKSKWKKCRAQSGHAQRFAGFMGWTSLVMLDEWLIKSLQRQIKTRNYVFDYWSVSGAANIAKNDAYDLKDDTKFIMGRRKRFGLQATKLLVEPNGCSGRKFFCDFDSDPYCEIMIYEIHLLYVRQAVYTAFNGCE